MAHPDLEELLNALLPFAQQQLARRGAFLPFGAQMTANGEVSLGASYTGEDPSQATDLLDMLVRGFQQEATSGRIRAAAVCVDVLVTPPGSTTKMDAICVQLEHREGGDVMVYVPYRKGWFGRVKYGELFATEGLRRIFAS